MGCIFVPRKASGSPYVVILISKIKSTPPLVLSPATCVGLAVSASGGRLWGPGPESLKCGLCNWEWSHLVLSGESAQSN